MKKLVLGITVEGSVDLITGQLRYFSDLGYKTYLLAPKHELTLAYCEREGCTLLPVRIEREISPFLDIFTLFQIVKYFIKIRPDIVNVGTPKMGLLGIIAAWICGVKVRINTCRGFKFETEKGFKKKLLVSLMKLNSKLSTKVVCISPSIKKMGIELSIFKDDKSFVIKKGSSNGLDLQRFNPATMKVSYVNMLRIKYGLEGNFVFGFIGRFVKDKGIKELFSAFTQSFEEHQNLRLIIIGSDLLASISDKELLAKFKDHPGVIFIGRTKEIPEYLTLMDALVVPTYREGFGNVFIEAASMGVPVISNNITGVKDAVNNGFNGILVTPYSSDELKNAMLVLYHKESLRKELGLNGIIWAKNFRREEIWQGLNSLYLN